MATELELKLMLQAEYLKSASEFLDGICASSDSDGQSRQPTLALMNAYFDTDDAQLMQGGMALRIRAVNGKYIQTVKTRGSSRIGMHERGEWEWFIPSDQLDLSLLKEIPLPDALADLAWQSELREVYRTDFERQVWNIQSGNTKMEVVCDQGKVTSSYGEDAINEIELELKTGSAADLYHFALQLAEQVPVQVSIVSKAQKGVRLKYGKIEFPESPASSCSNLVFAAYWYEVWLVYWEAMFFMQDEVLMQPIRHAISQLAGSLPNDLVTPLTMLDKQLDQLLAKEEGQLLPTLAGMKDMGKVMLTVGQWLNQQTM